MTKRIAALATVAVATVAMSACSMGTDSGADETLVIGVDLPLAGPKKPAHEETVNALQLYLERAGGKAGRYKIELKIYNNATETKGGWDADTCRKNAEEHVATANEVAVLGTVNSGCTVVMLPILNADPGGPLLQVSHANTLVGLTQPADAAETAKYYPSGKRNFGRTVVPDNVQGVADAQFAAKDLKVARCLVLDDGSGFGKGLAKVFAAEAREQGIEILGEQSWDAKQASYSPIFTAVKDAKPDCVYLGGSAENNGAQLVRDKFRILGDNNTVKLFGGQGFSGSKELQEMREAQGMYTGFSGYAAADVQYRVGPGGQFFDAFKERYGVHATSNYLVTALQSLQLIMKAIERSDGTRRSVRDQVFSGDGFTIDGDEAFIGKTVGLDPRTGDIDVHDTSIFRMTDYKETFLRVWVIVE